MPQNKPPGISPIKRRLVDAYATMLADPAEDIGYQHTLLCQTSLPYRQPPTEIRRWERRNGRAILEIEAGRAYNPQGRQDDRHALALRGEGAAGFDSLEQRSVADGIVCNALILSQATL